MRPDRMCALSIPRSPRTGAERCSRRLRWTAALAVAGILFAGALVLAYVVYENRYFERRFAEVAPGRLFRSSQPRGDQWKDVAQHGVRTVVNLRPAAESPEDFADSRRGCRENGLIFVNIPVDHRPPTDAKVEEFLALCADPARRPILVHCEHGRKRTGLFVGLYGVVFEGWSEAGALDAVQDIYGKPVPPEYAALLRRVAGDREAWLTRLPAPGP